MDNRTRTEVADGLRSLADFLDAHPEVPCRLTGPVIDAGPVLDDRAQIVAVLAALAPCTMRDGIIPMYVDFVHDFGGVTYKVTVRKEAVGAVTEVLRPAAEFTVDADIARIAAGEGVPA